MPARSGIPERAGRLLLDEGIARLALLALAERDVQRLLERAVVCIAEALGVEHVQVFELLPDGSTLVSRASLGGERRAVSRLRLERPTASQASYTLDVSSPVISMDLTQETRFRPSRAQHVQTVVATVSVPLFGRSNRPYGVLEVGTSSRFRVAPDSVADFLQSAGHLLVPAVERARLEAACRFLAESQSRLVSADDFRGSVAALAEIAVPRLADWCCIDVVLPTGAIECVALAHGDRRVRTGARKLRMRLAADPSAEVGVARVVRTGQSEFHFDLGAALSVGPGQDRAVAELAETAGFRAAIVTPLAARGHTFGAVTLVAQKARRLFDEGDVMLADAFAAHAGLALDDVRLFFGKGHEPPALSRVAGVTTGIGLLDSEIMGTRLVRAAADERDRVAHIVDHVVAAHRVASGQAVAVGASSDAVDVVRRVVERIRSSLPARWTIRLEQPAVRVVGDDDTLYRIVASLVDNAVRYSPEGGSISVRLDVGEAGIRLAVEDDGIGIPPAERDLVFEKFHRGEDARALAAEGIGVGLYICRELATRLNGRIEVQANRERGTTVVVELPLAGASSEPHEPLALDPSRRGHTRRRRRSPA